MLNAIKELKDLCSPPSNHLHRLRGEREGQWAISVNGPWRLCFRFDEGDIFDLELTQYYLRGEIMLPENRRPVHPGEIIRYEYLEPLHMTQQQLADALGITRVRINEIILGKRKITPDTAFRLAKYFKTTAEFWMNMQNNLDMWETLQNHKVDYDKIHPLAS